MRSHQPKLFDQSFFQQRVDSRQLIEGSPSPEAARGPAVAPCPPSHGMPRPQPSWAAWGFRSGVAGAGGGAARSKLRPSGARPPPSFVPSSRPESFCSRPPPPPCYSRVTVTPRLTCQPVLDTPTTCRFTSIEQPSTAHSHMPTNSSVSHGPQEQPEEQGQEDQARRGGGAQPERPGPLPAAAQEDHCHGPQQCQGGQEEQEVGRHHAVRGCDSFSFDGPFGGSSPFPIPSGHTRTSHPSPPATD